MEKEKILQELEDKLLPSVQNLEKQQATEHDFFPALLWMLLEKSKGSEKLLKELAVKHTEELEAATNRIIENNQEIRKIYGEQLGKAANFIVSKNQESATKFEQIYHEEFKKITESIQVNSKTAQEKTDELIENKISMINQKIEEIKTIQLKTEKKIFTGFVVFAIFQLVTLSALAFIVMRPL
ncbi:hypothetical protein JCM14076_00480 [Methylosoma difficile]